MSSARRIMVRLLSPLAAWADEHLPPHIHASARRRWQAMKDARLADALRLPTPRSRRLGPFWQRCGLVVLAPSVTPALRSTADAIAELPVRPLEVVLVAGERIDTSVVGVRDRFDRICEVPGATHDRLAIVAGLTMLAPEATVIDAATGASALARMGRRPTNTRPRAELLAMGREQPTSKPGAPVALVPPSAAHVVGLHAWQEGHADNDYGDNDTVLVVDPTDGPVEAGQGFAIGVDAAALGPTPRRVVTTTPLGPPQRDLVRIWAAGGAEVTLVHDMAVPDHPDVRETSLASPSEALSAPPGRVRFGTIRGDVEDGDRPSPSGRLRELQGSHDGETCVIVGNGPSLRETDLRLLRDVPTFAVNAIFLHEDLPFRPTYYVVEDAAVIEDRRLEIAGFDVGERLLPIEYQRHFPADFQATWFRLDRGFYRRSSPHYCKPRFSTRIDDRVYSGQTVSYVNLQLAFAMGFARVLLVGMDFSYTAPAGTTRRGDELSSPGPDPNHFHGDYFGGGRIWRDPKLDRVALSFQLARKVFESHNRAVINCTEGGDLEIFPRSRLLAEL